MCVTFNDYHIIDGVYLGDPRDFNRWVLIKGIDQHTLKAAVNTRKTGNKSSHVSLYHWKLQQTKTK